MTSELSFCLQAKPLLPQMKSNDVGKICVVIDLDETLVHSSFKVSWTVGTPFSSSVKYVMFFTGTNE